MSDNDNKIVYILVGVGITLLAVIAIFSFLTNRKVERMSWKAENVVQQGLGVLGTVSQTPVLNQTPAYDERIYNMLSEKMDNNQKMIHDHLEDVNSNVNNLNNSLKSTNYGQNYSQYKTPSLGVNVNMPKAGSVTSIKTSGEDKIRQKEFGMN